MKNVMVLGLCLLYVGCGGAPSDAPELANVDGVVLLNELPLPSGTITFMPDSSRGTTGPIATGIIDSSGRFTLRTKEPGDGAQIGFHRVAIEAYEPTPPFDPEHPKEEPLVPRIPVRYFDSTTSKLEAEVKAGGENTFTFELKK